MTDGKHKNYELLNLIGYGLAKYDVNFIREFDCKTKAAFYEYIVSLGIAQTIGVVKNRQDLFDLSFVFNLYKKKIDKSLQKLG